MKTPAPSTHSKFSASAAHRWIACPGSIKLSEQAPPQVDSPYAVEGTRAHECLEAILKNPKMRLSTEAWLRKSYPHEMVEHAARAAQEIERRAQGSKVHSERKVMLPFIHKEFGGTLDAAVIELFGTLTIADFKYGVWPVDPKDNPQLIAYALAVAHEYDYNFDEVCLLILQPRASDHGDFVREYRISMEELKRWASTFLAAVKLAGSKKPELQSGDHCKWCPAKSICPEISERAMKEVGIYFEPVVDPALTVPAPSGLSAVTLGRILDRAGDIEVWLSEVRSQAFRQMEGGLKIPGWKLVPKRATRQWINAEKAEREARKAFGDIAFDVSLKSPAQLEKLAADAKPWVSKRAQAVSSGQTLARVTDPRESVALGFEPIEDQPTQTKRKK